MIIEEKEQEACRRGRYRKKRKKILSRIIFLVISSFVFFILGQAFANAVQAGSEIVKKEVTAGNVSYATTTNEDLYNTTVKDNIEESKESLYNKNEWNLILVNPWNALSHNFSVNLVQLKNGHSVDERMYPDLQSMLDDARAEGLSPIICSSFRTMEKQQSLFNNQVNKYISRGYSKEEANIESSKWVAIPGTSEHQTGLAVDIVSSNNQVLNEEQEKTPEQQWLMKNCYKYGFILRYPSDKSEITGIGYEPWHYRYVGKEASKEIMEKEICLEEYLK